jgi:Trypsin-like peptidase domain
LSDGIPTDGVIESATLATAVNSGTRRVPCSGARIANSRGVPGTMCCVAVTCRGRQRVLLTNYHVLYGRGAAEREAIWSIDQSMPENGAPPEFNLVGRTVRGKFGIIRYEDAEFHVDCAIGSLESARTPPRIWPFASRMQVRSPDGVVPGERVATITNEGRREGIVIDAAYPDVVEVRGQLQSAPRQILIKPLDGDGASFAGEGDSGAVLLDTQGRFVGLLWGVNRRGESVACHAGPVLRALDIRAPYRAVTLSGLFRR